MPVLLSASALPGATSSTCDPVVETPALSTEQLGTAIQRTDMPTHISDAITNTHPHFSCLLLLSNVCRSRASPPSRFFSPLWRQPREDDRC
jgi:hypothetical protein